MKQFQFDTLTMGTCYYPEHWPETMWPDDLKRMKKAGIRAVRITEFAWTLMEPEEGQFTFGLFDRFLSLCSEHEMKVILGTPTATPPIWLTERYPEVLNCRPDGIPYRHGGRRHYNYNSPKYRSASAAVTEAMASHFGQHPAVIGWQIDNEFNCETDEFYSGADTAAFRAWAKQKYRTLDKLNDAWGTVVWSQIYTAWDQIHVPRPVINQAYNPHYFLDYRRFISDSAVSFCRMQAEIIRKYRKEGDFITTNGLFDLNNHQMQEECLDLFMYDSYPNFAFGLDRDPVHSADLNDRKWSRNLTEARSVCPHFGIMEQQSGAGSWVSRMEGPMPRPGQLRLWAMQSVAHGADYVSFFRWRTATVGTEIYWHGILDYDNRDNRRLAEIRDFGRCMEKIAGICGSKVRTAFALLKDYDNVWDARTDEWHRRLDRASEPEIFAASQLYHTPYDVVYLNDRTKPEDLAAWPVVFYPHPVIMTVQRAKLLEAYAAQGGIVIIGCRSGYKDIRGHCVMLPQPGLLAGLSGTDVREYTFASPAEKEPFCRWGGDTFRMPVFNDVPEQRDSGTQPDTAAQLNPEGVKSPPDPDAAAGEFSVLAVYGSSYYAGAPAVTEHTFGKGRCIHVGATFTRELVHRLFVHTGILEPFARIAQVPEQVETVLREKDGKQYLFLLNYTCEAQVCRIRSGMTALLAGGKAPENLTLPPYGIEVLKVQN